MSYSITRYLLDLGIFHKLCYHKKGGGGGVKWLESTKKIGWIFSFRHLITKLRWFKLLQNINFWTNECYSVLFSIKPARPCFSVKFLSNKKIKISLDRINMTEHRALIFFLMHFHHKLICRRFLLTFFRDFLPSIL